MNTVRAQVEMFDRRTAWIQRVLGFAADLCIFGAGFLAGLGFADYMGWLHVAF